MLVQALPDYGPGILGWRSLLVTQVNDLVGDCGMDPFVNSTLYAWLYEQAEFIGSMGNLSCPLPLPDPPSGDGVEGGLQPVDDGLAAADQPLGSPTELEGGLEPDDDGLAAADQPLGGPPELCAAADQPLFGLRPAVDLYNLPPGGPTQLCAAADQLLCGPAQLCAAADQPLGGPRVQAVVVGQAVRDQAVEAGYDPWLLPNGQFRPLRPGVRESRDAGE